MIIRRALIIPSARDEWQVAWLASWERPAGRWLLPTSYAAQIILTLWGRLFGYRVVWLGANRRPGALFYKLLRLAGRLAHAIIVANRQSELHYLRAGLPSAKIHLIYPPCKVAAEPRALAKSILTVGCDASATIENGLATLLRAVSLSQDILGGLKLIIGGRTSERGKIEWSARQLGLAGAVQFSPGESLLWLEPIHIYVAPHATADTAPLFLLQSMALGKAVIATDILAHKEFIEHEKNGLLVAGGDAEALSQALIRLARADGLLESLSSANVKMAKTRLAMEVFQKKMAVVFPV